MSRANDIETVAISFLKYVRENGRNGSWIHGADAFRAAIKKNPKLKWVRYIRQKPKARIAVTGVIERLRQNEFSYIEREKRGSWRSAPVFFRVRV